MTARKEVKTYQELVSDTATLKTVLDRHAAMQPGNKTHALRAIEDCLDLLDLLLLYRHHLPTHSTDSEIREVGALPRRIISLMQENSTTLKKAYTHLADAKKALSKSVWTKVGVRDKSQSPRRIGRAAQGLVLVLACLAQMEDVTARFEWVTFELEFYERIEVAVRLCYGLKPVEAEELDWDDKCMICQELYLADDDNDNKDGDGDGKKKKQKQKKKKLGQLTIRLPCHGILRNDGHTFHLQCAFLWFKEKDRCPYCREAMLIYPVKLMETPVQTHVLGWRGCDRPL